jgi:hypothetical protein
MQEFYGRSGMYFRFEVGGKMGNFGSDIWLDACEYLDEIGEKTKMDMADPDAAGAGGSVLGFFRIQDDPGEVVGYVVRRKNTL